MASEYGKWRVIGSIGEGGQANVFLVENKEDPGPNFALKRLKNIGRLARFEQEVEAVRKLDHPNIIRIVDSDLAAAKPYLVMEHCEGGQLPFRARSSVQEYADALEVFETICGAVAYAHDHGIVHRDIKPANILIRADGSVVVSDFGICYVDDAGTRHTVNGEIMGSRGFTAPEVEEGVVPISKKADSYSLGKLLYWMFARRPQVPPREDFRSPKWDLRGRSTGHLMGIEKPELQHINKMLAFMIAENPAERRDAANLAELAQWTRRTLGGGYTAYGRDVEMICRFCGEGGLNLVTDNNPTDVRNFGITPVAGSTWLIYTCASCGHVEMFRPDDGRMKERWGLKQ